MLLSATNVSRCWLGCSLYNTQKGFLWHTWTWWQRKSFKATSSETIWDILMEPSSQLGLIRSSATYILDTIRYFGCIKIFWLMKVAEASLTHNITSPIVTTQIQNNDTRPPQPLSPFSVDTADNLMLKTLGRFRILVILEINYRTTRNTIVLLRIER